MDLLVVDGATLHCSRGTSQSSLRILPKKSLVQSTNYNAPVEVQNNIAEVNAESGGRSPANILDGKPFVNIHSFGMCTSIGNPAVVASTAGAMGVLTPTPCMSNTDAWVSGSPDTLVDNVPAVHMGCKLSCRWGGEISVTSAGQSIKLI